MNTIINQAKSKVFFGVLCLCLSILLTFLYSNISHAVAVVGFDAGRIIDDAVMTNSGSMSVVQIQNFLNSKVPICDTNHAGFYGSSGTWYGPPFTCLKDYTENGLSAAQIIYNASRQYNINPQVLIVLLQKEQGLVTDAWPAPYQYTSATGYGCPDSTPGVCDSSYYGFTNQINNAAKLFHSVITSSPTWYSPYVLGNNYIQWNPNESCGVSTVNIQNLATASLYDYTPYRPNQAALNAGYGTGDSCSSYGNRNFYLYFTEWFGATTSNSNAHSIEFIRLNYYTGKIQLVSYPYVCSYYCSNNNIEVSYPSAPGDGNVVPLFRPNGDLSFVRLNSSSGKVNIMTFSAASGFQQLSSDIDIPYPSVPGDGNVVPLFRPNGDLSFVRLNYFTGNVQVVTYAFNGYFQNLSDNIVTNYPALNDPKNVKVLYGK